jgi:hypothetical protein
MKKLTLVLMATAMVISVAHARGKRNYGARKAACNGKSNGDICTFQGRRGEKSGTCKESRKNPADLVCKKDRKGKKVKKGRKGGRWKAKIQACEGKSVGAVCSFESRKGTKEGTCQAGRRNPNVLKCKRNR